MSVMCFDLLYFLPSSRLINLRTLIYVSQRITYNPTWPYLLCFLSFLSEARVQYLFAFVYSTHAVLDDV